MNGCPTLDCNHGWLWLEAVFGRVETVVFVEGLKVGDDLDGGSGRFLQALLEAGGEAVGFADGHGVGEEEMDAHDDALAGVAVAHAVGLDAEGGGFAGDDGFEAAGLFGVGQVEEGRARSGGRVALRTRGY